VKFSRQVRYYYLRLIRLRGDPRDLALGMALGVFAGILPIIPFQTAFAIMLAVFLKASKITAAVGTWVSNPLNFYFLYFYTYKLGAALMGLPDRNAGFSSIMSTIRSGEEPLALIWNILGAGTNCVMAFLLGGVLLGILVSIPSYFIFLYIFRSIRSWRKKRKEARS